MIANQKRRAPVAAALTAVGILAVAATASAQGCCTLEELAGTYAVEIHGSSTFMLGPAAFPRHWSLASAPFIFVGWISIQADGTVYGEACDILGDVTSGLTALPLSGKVAEFDKNTCTAVLEWWGSPRPGGPPGLHRERYVFVDNGREFRSMLVQSPSGSMAWTGRGHRMTHGPAPVHICSGSQFLQGDVLLQVETVSSMADPTSPASAASMLRLTVAQDGSFSGTAFVKDPAYHELPVEGTFIVQPNCTVELTLESPMLPGITQHGRGVIFEQGKRGFLIMPLEVTQPGSPTLVPAFARCELLSLGR
jgi:hypothetical protein